MGLVFECVPVDDLLERIARLGKADEPFVGIAKIHHEDRHNRRKEQSLLERHRVRPYPIIKPVIDELPLPLSFKIHDLMHESSPFRAFSCLRAGSSAQVPTQALSPTPTVFASKGRVCHHGHQSPSVTYTSLGSIVMLVNTAVAANKMGLSTTLPPYASLLDSGFNQGVD